MKNTKKFHQNCKYLIVKLNPNINKKLNHQLDTQLPFDESKLK